MHQFDNPEAYDRAVEMWERRTVERAVGNVVVQQRQQQQAAVAAQAQAEAVQALGNRFAARQALVEVQHPDFQEVTFRNEALTKKLSEPVGLLLINAENGPDLLYALGKNPEEAARLSAITDPVELAVEFGKFTARASATAAKPTPVRQQSPPRSAPRSQPAAPSQRRAEPARLPVGREPSMEEYEAYRMPQLKAERRAQMFYHTGEGGR